MRPWARLRQRRDQDSLLPEAYTPKHLAEKILTSKAALEGERKQVTVLFADLKGSMELLADRDPEEARKLLDPVLERMMEAIHRYEGTVNQVMGPLRRPACSRGTTRCAPAMRRCAVYTRVFTLGTLGGALVIPATAAMSEMGIELIVEAFAVVVIGGLGSMRGAFVGALVVGVLRAAAIAVYPELEMLLIYLIVIAVLLLRPRGFFGSAAA